MGRTVYLIALGVALGLPSFSVAALPIELEVAAEGDAPFGSLQKWNSVLIEMDLARVRLRGVHAGDEPGLEERGSGGSKRFFLLGVINRRDELVLPGGVFRAGQRAELKAYFEGLPKQLDESRRDQVAFGLSREEFTKVLAALSSPFNESTLDAAPHELLTALTRDVDLPVEGDVTMRARLRDAPPFHAQMKGLTRGTVLAAMLRSAGLQFAPDKLGREPLTLRVVRLDAGIESWPVGWKPLESPRAVAPQMYEFRNIEIANFTLAAALDALAPPMGAPIVVDQHTIAARKIDLAAIQAKFPRKKTYVKRAVDALLSQGRLEGELRIDEAGQPFYWITQFGNDSPRAIELP